MSTLRLAHREKHCCSYRSKYDSAAETLGGNRGMEKLWAGMRPHARRNGKAAAPGACEEGLSLRLVGLP